MTVLPDTPAYDSLSLFSVLQASNSQDPAQKSFYSIRWAHEITNQSYTSPEGHGVREETALARYV